MFRKLLATSMLAAAIPAGALSTAFVPAQATTSDVPPLCGIAFSCTTTYYYDAALTQYAGRISYKCALGGGELSTGDTDAPYSTFTQGNACPGYPPPY
jgi:hypothetical protein